MTIKMKGANMRIAENVEMLKLGRKDKQGALYPVLLWDDKDVVLIDTCLPGQMYLLREAIADAGFSFERITRLFLTHQDLDHIGAARAISELGAKVYAHEAETPFIQGNVTSVRLARMEARLAEMDRAERDYYEQTKQNAHNYFTKIDFPLKDGETVDCCGGIKAVHTPGHMPGHMALLLKKSGVIVAGDAANITDGKLTGANPVFTQDMPLAGESFNKMMAEKPAFVATFHGGLYTCVDAK